MIGKVKSLKPIENEVGVSLHANTVELAAISSTFSVGLQKGHQDALSPHLYKYMVFVVAFMRCVRVQCLAVSSFPSPFVFYSPLPRPSLSAIPDS